MKKPGEFKKSKQRNKNIQHNRDQLKLLKEGTIPQAELFILDPNGFKRVTIVRWDCEDSPSLSGAIIVYLSHGGKKSKLRTGLFYDKDRGNRCRILEEGFIDWEHCFGIVVKEEMLKENSNGIV